MQEHAPASLLVYMAVTVVWILGCLPSTIMEVRLSPPSGSCMP